MPQLRALLLLTAVVSPGFAIRLAQDRLGPGERLAPWLTTVAGVCGWLALLSILVLVHGLVRNASWTVRHRSFPFKVAYFGASMLVHVVASAGCGIGLTLSDPDWLF